jgi:hypothetical protein
MFHTVLYALTERIKTPSYGALQKDRAAASEHKMTNTFIGITCDSVGFPAGHEKGRF